MDKIKTLFFAASPVGSSGLMVEEEIRAITKKIRAADYRDSIELVPALAARPDDLIEMLNQHKPQIVHFSAHGKPTGEILLLDKVGGLPKAVKSHAIRELFKTMKDNIRVVLLNACYSKVQARAIVKVIDCAIGIKIPITNQAAIAFAASFYGALGFGRSVKEAYEQGRAAILLEGIDKKNIPELLVKEGVDPSGIFLQPQKKGTGKNYNIAFCGNLGKTPDKEPCHLPEVEYRQKSKKGWWRKYSLPLAAITAIFAVFCIFLFYYYFPAKSQLVISILTCYEDVEGVMHPLLEGAQMKSGEGYCIYIKPNRACYLYAFQVDTNGNAFQLFPNQEKYNTKNNPLPKGETWLPNMEQFYVLDNNLGREYIYIFASTRKIDQFDHKADLKKLHEKSTIMGVAGVREKKGLVKVRHSGYHFEYMELLQQQHDKNKNEFVYKIWFSHN